MIMKVHGFMDCVLILLSSQRELTLLGKFEFKLKIYLIFVFNKIVHVKLLNS